jgi:ATP-dependent 26S proteasome regulatory subunit
MATNKIDTLDPALIRPGLREPRPEHQAQDFHSPHFQDEPQR